MKVCIVGWVGCCDIVIKSLGYEPDKTFEVASEIDLMHIVWQFLQKEIFRDGEMKKINVMIAHPSDTIDYILYIDYLKFRQR